MNYSELSIAENKPFPNNTIPVRYYKKVISDELIDAEDVIRWLKTQNFYNFWINGIYDCHHFHSNTHELIVIIRGEASIQIGGPESSIVEVNKGDAIFLPAGTAHKLISSTNDFQVVGAYPERIDYDFQKGNYDYDEVKRRIEQVPAPNFELSAKSLEKSIA